MMTSLKVRGSENYKEQMSFRMIVKLKTQSDQRGF